MIQSFRKLFQSPLGLALTLGFVVLIALAFASADITGGSFGGVGGSERVATVGDKRISTSDLRSTVSASFDNARAENPSLTMEEYLNAGAIDGLLEQMVERAAIAEYGVNNGMRVGESLIGSELAQMQAFQGPDGKFSQELYNTTLQRQGLSDAMVRDDIQQGLVSRMVLLPATTGDVLPKKIARRYAALLGESRKGGVALIPSPAFIDEAKAVPDATLKTYLSENRARYTQPERRTIRYASFTADALGDEAAATDAEIAARFKENAAQYAAREERTIEQLILPTEAGAEAILKQLSNPAQLSAVAGQTGLETNTTTVNSQSALASASSAAVAKAVYAAQPGTIAGPVRGPLGYYLVRIVKVDAIPARTLAQVRDELAETITAEKTRTALADRASALEERLQAGETMAEVAKRLGTEVQTTRPVTSDGTIFGTQGEKLADEEARLVSAVFAMDGASKPQIAAGADGESYVIFAPGTITRAAPPPFAELKEQLTRDYRLTQAQKEARTAADKVMKAVQGGKSLSAALADLGIRTPPVDTIDMTRRQLMEGRQQGGGVPPPLALMFTMAPKTAKKLEAPQNLGWFVVALNAIDVPEIADDDPMIAATQSQLSQIRQQELISQLRIAVRDSVDVTRNENAIEVVRSQLAPGN